MTGRLALLLAVAPGYATAIWPAAGVALIAAMQGRWQYLPGIWLGSVLTNTQLSSMDSAAIAINGMVGLGAAVQALVSAGLARRAVGVTCALDNSRDIFLFLILVGPVGCLISATIGTTTLLQTGAIEPGNFVFNWMTWWIGDALGAMLIGVSLLVFFGQPREIWQRRLKILLGTTVISSIVWVGGYLSASRLEVERQQVDFSRSAEQLQQSLQAELDRAGVTLAGLRGLLRTHPGLTRQQFDVYSAAVMANRPGLQAISWNPLVKKTERVEFERGVRAEGLTGFQIHTATEPSPGVAPLADSHVPITYIFPLAANRKALGFDLSSEATRRTALLDAARQATPVATDPVDLVQETDSQKGLVIFDAQFSDDGQLLGYFSLVMRLGTVTQQALQGTQVSGLRVELLAAREPPGNTTLAVFPLAAQAAETGAFRAMLPLEVATKQWWMDVQVTQEFLTGTRSLLPWSLLAGGLLFSILLQAYLLTTSGDAYRQALSNRELRAAMQRLQVALDELKNTQNQLLDSRKFAALGSTVAGVAHELSTPVGNSITALSICPIEIQNFRNTLESGDLTRSRAEQFFSNIGESLTIAERGLHKAADLIKSFKLISADETSEGVRKIELRGYLTSVIQYLRPQFQCTPHKVELEVIEEIWLETSPGGLSQVITNLLTNSLRYAFVEGKSGTITILAQQTAEGGAQISISDDGIGIPQALQKRVFEPFFTTGREIGGTGLGLHLVQDIVANRLQGEIRLVSEVGAGCRFDITLPAGIKAGS